MKIIATTSDAYHHLIPIFCYLFNHNWSQNQHVEIVGYAKPDCQLPDNFSFHSLGSQHGKSKQDFSNDLRPYFEKQDDWFTWLFEDTFIRSIDFERFNSLMRFTLDYSDKSTHPIGRINLSGECVKQDCFGSELINGAVLYDNFQTAKYRLSTQPSIWNKGFLLQYLKPNLSPWDFESQHPKNDGWRIIGFDRDNSPLVHNEGVTRHDIRKYDFTGIKEEQLQEMKTLGII